MPWVFGPLGWGDMDEFEARLRVVEESVTGMPSQIRVPAGWGDMDEFESRLRIVEDTVISGGAIFVVDNDGDPVLDNEEQEVTI